MPNCSLPGSLDAALSTEGYVGNTGVFGGKVRLVFNQLTLSSWPCLYDSNKQYHTHPSSHAPTCLTCMPDLDPDPVVSTGQAVRELHHPAPSQPGAGRDGRDQGAGHQPLAGVCRTFCAGACRSFSLEQ